MFNFLNIDRRNYIKNLIKTKILINLNQIEFDSIIYFLYTIIEYTILRFVIKQELYNDAWHQLKQNNNRDIISFFNLLLPYIDDKDNTYELHNKIFNLEDISCKKKDSYDLSINNYEISNIQYNIYTNKDNKEEKLTINHISKNYYLILETIDRISNKLYVNWLNVIPITLDNYKNTELFKNSIKLINDLNNSFNIKNISINNMLIPTTNFTLNNTYFTTNEAIINNKHDSTIDTLKDVFEYFKQDSLNYSIMLKNKGISIGDVFNTIYYDLFMDIVKIKWLIYQDTFNNRDHDIIYIEKFNEEIAISGLYLNIKWDELILEEQLLFINKWNMFRNKVLNTYNTNKRSGYFYLLKHIIIFMENNYDKMNSIVNLYNYVKITTDTNIDLIDDDDIVDDENQLDISAIDLVNRIKIIPIEHIYMYLLDTIQKFMMTWYGKNIILKTSDSRKGIIHRNISNYKFNYNSYFNYTIDQSEFTQFDKDIILPENLTIKYKFIYNFAKAFVLIYEAENKIYMRPIWYNMNQSDRQFMIDLLNKSYYNGLLYSKTSNSIYSLNLMSFHNYYKRTYSNTTKLYNNLPIFDNYSIKQPSDINLGIYIGHHFYEQIRDFLINIVFECHIMKGLLSELIFNNNLTDKAILGNTHNEYKNNQMTNIKKYVLTDKYINSINNHAYYFLTDKLYGDLNEIHLNNKKTFIDLITDDYRWYSYYSLDWVAQINFFYHYINNRVIYITGATGQGKSTQMPKLFLYSLKMIDKKSNGKVICTQPRIQPTINNAERIAYEMGVPISEQSINYKKEIKTYNPYIQYQTQKSKHIVSNHNGLLLKLVTDKILYMDILKSPILKEIEKSIDENNESESIEFNVYKKENMYDILMVDESHEHNINMDLILSIARDTVNYNNSLKLVIISATMSDDEYIYRRYYKEINDNFSYPYNFLNESYGLTRYYIDRRIHISPPGETTQFKVNEIYKTKPINTYDEAELLAIEKALNIVSTTSSGDILLFSLSTKNIQDICININKSLSSSSDVICLPFYRELPERWNIFDNLTVKIRQITINRENMYDDIKQTSIQNIKYVNPNTYKRAIIVCTNIAEASLTIDSLKYVIDTGYNIIVSTNYLTSETIIDKTPISETSRIQRRGRVGRVSDGTVYYMYMKDSRKNIKTNYTICIKNIYAEIYDIAARIHNDNLLIPEFNYITYIWNRIELKDLKNYPNMAIFIDSKLFINLIINQYTYRGYLLPSILNLMSKTTHHSTLNYTNFSNYLNKSNFNFKIDETYNIITNRNIRLISGYRIFDIYDIQGQLFIIHPDEKNFKRNLLTGAIIQTTTISNNKIKLKSNDNYISEKINTYIQMCFYYNLFIDNEIIPIHKDIFVNHDYNKFINLNFKYDKSTIGRILQNIITKLQITDNEQLSNEEINRCVMLTIIYGYVCDIDHIIIIMIILLVVSEFNIENLNKNYKVFQSLYANDDIYVYYELANKIYQNKYKFDNTNIEQNKIKFENEKTLYINEKQQINKNIDNNNNFWDLNIPLDIYIKFNILDNQNKLNTNKNIFNYINENKSNINEQNINKLQKLLNSLNINFDIIKTTKFLKLYIDITTKMDELKNIHNIEYITNNLLWFKYYLPIKKSIDEFTNIKKAFIYGFGLMQTIIYNAKDYSYYNINNMITPYKLLRSTLSINNEMSVYLFKSINNELSIIINSDFDTLVECNLFNYNPLFFETVDNSILFNTNVNKDVFYSFLDKYKSLYANKHKYLSFLKNDTYTNINENFTKIFSYGNNYTDYLIRLFNFDIDLNKQFGGSNLIKIKLNKIPNYCKKYNIKYKDFLQIINQSEHYIKNNYLYIYN